MKKIVFILIGIITLLAIPATVYLSSKNQELRKKAAPATTLSLSPATVTKKVGDEFTLEAKINTADNQVVATEINLSFDATKLEAVSITNGAAFPNILSSGSVGAGTASIAVGAANTTTPVKGTGTAAVIKFKALAATSAPISVKFTQETFVGALGESTNNVLVSSTPATVSITGAGGTTGAQPTPTPTLAPAIITFGGTQGITYAPAAATAKVGQPIIWKGDFVTHPLESADNLWTVVKTGTEFTHTFTTPGTYTYFCRVHGSKTSGMKGQIVVTADGATTPTPTISLTPTISASQSASASAVQITSPTSNQALSTETPTLKGKAPPNSTVTITIYSTPQTVTVVADANGNWTYTVPTALESGPHTIVVAALDPTTNQTKTATLAFVVSGSGTEASESAIPITGVVENTIMLLSIGVLFIVAGVFVPAFSKR